MSEARQGVLFPAELKLGVLLKGESPVPEASNMADYYRFRVLQKGLYSFVLNSSIGPSGIRLTLADASGNPIRLSGADAAAQATDRGPLTLLAGFSYVNATVWIVARLAEALQHAHQRGVLHRDVKPSNILLSAEGQPMLLDFNLAENLQAEHALAVAAVGGTVAYMAPEHLRALATRDPALARQVDHRADLYGLGMVLYELLTGRNPFGQNASDSPLPVVEAMAAERARFAPSLRQHRPDAPWSLDSIARKCLDPSPANRYQQAEHLAEDLRRYLEDRPLKYAPELSWRERLAKWRRRHSRMAVNGLIAAAAVVLLAVLYSALTQLNSAVAQQTKESFLSRARQVRCYLNTAIGEDDQLRQGVTVCEEALKYYAVLQPGDWQKQAVWRRLEPKQQQQVAEDICELLQLLARARLMRAPVEAVQYAVPAAPWLDR